MPTNCPLTALPGTKVFPKGWGGYLQDATLIGRSPVWAGMPLEVHVYTGAQGYHVVWTGTKILWEVGQNLTSVTVRVKNLATGALAWWGKGDQPPSRLSWIASQWMVRVGQLPVFIDRRMLLNGCQLAGWGMAHSVCCWKLEGKSPGGR